MSKEVKQAKSVQCPLVVGQNAVFILDNNKVAQSKVVSISEVKYQSSDNTLKVTFETIHSIYENISIVVKPMPFYVDQVISKGTSVNSLNNGAIFVDEIIAITEVNNVFNLIIKDSNGTIFSCPFLKS